MTWSATSLGWMTLGFPNGVRLLKRPQMMGFPSVPEAAEGAMACQACISRLRSAMWNFSFLLGFIDGSGLNRSL